MSTIGREFDVNRALDRELKAQFLIQALPLTHWVTLGGILFFIVCKFSHLEKVEILNKLPTRTLPCPIFYLLEYLLKTNPGQGSILGPAGEVKEYSRASLHHRVWDKDLLLPSVKAETVMH